MWFLCCVVSWGSLSNSAIGDAGAGAVAAALVHVPHLQELWYVAYQLGPMCFRAPLRMPLAVVEGRLVVTGCEAIVVAVTCVVCRGAACGDVTSAQRVRLRSPRLWLTCPSCKRFSTWLGRSPHVFSSFRCAVGTVCHGLVLHGSL